VASTETVNLSDSCNVGAGPVRQLIAVLLALVLIPSLPFLAPPVYAQDCAGCQPPRQSQPNWSGQLDVCFTLGFEGTSIPTWIQQGILSYVGTWLQNNSVSVSFAFRTDTSNNCDGAQVKIFPDSTATGTVIAQASPTYGIGVNPAYISGSASNTDLWKWNGPHEMMHVLGFGHTDQNCDGTSNGTGVSYSIMAPGYTGLALPSSTACGDEAGLTNAYSSGSYGNSYSDYEYPYSQDHEDCFDIYEVWTAWWYDDGGNYHDQLVSETYVGWTCNPPA
jgi:hypothetical protein